MLSLSSILYKDYVNGWMDKEITDFRNYNIYVLILRKLYQMK